MNNTNQLTFTRFIAAILIVVYHFGTNLFPFNLPYIKPFFQNSNLGVSYFFLLSGFVMVVAYGNREKPLVAHAYLQNRAARILPLYYFAIILMIVYYLIRIVILKITSNYTPTYTDFALNVILIQAWIPGKATTVNTAAWSLSVEAFFYLSFPFLLNQIYPKLFPRQKAWLAVVVFLATQFLFHCLLYSYPSLGGYFFYNPLLHLNEFISGNVVGFLFLQRKQMEEKGAFFFVILFFILSVLGVYLPVKNVSYHNGIYTLFFAPLVYFLATDHGMVAQLFKKRLFVFLGEISYGVYILQFPVYLFFTATLTYCGYKMNNAMFFMFLIILCIISGISFELIEKPLRNIIKNRKLNHS